MFKFGQKEVTKKYFYGQRQITDIFTMGINKLMISNKVPCDNGKDCRYLWVIKSMDHQHQCLSKHLKIYFATVHPNSIKNLPIQCHSMSLRKIGRYLNTKRFGMRSSHSYLKNWQQNR